MAYSPGDQQSGRLVRGDVTTFVGGDQPAQCIQHRTEQCYERMAAGAKVLAIRSRLSPPEHMQVTSYTSRAVRFTICLQLTKSNTEIT